MTKKYTDIISTVTSPVGLLTLVLLVTEGLGILECAYAEFNALQRTWEDKYQDSKHRNLYVYLDDKNKRIRYVATNLAGYMNDQSSLPLLEKNTHHEYDQVRICARSSIAQRGF